MKKKSREQFDDKILSLYRIVKRSRTREGFTVERIAASPVSYGTK